MKLEIIQRRRGFFEGILFFIFLLICLFLMKSVSSFLCCFWLITYLLILIIMSNLFLVLGILCLSKSKKRYVIEVDSYKELK